MFVVSESCRISRLSKVERALRAPFSEQVPPFGSLADVTKLVLAIYSTGPERASFA
jgi:hypothetical protein